MSLNWDAPEFDAAPPNDAVSWFRQRLVMSDAEFYELEASARTRAFTVSELADLDLVSDVWRAVDRAVEQGTGIEEFRTAVEADVTEGWGGDIPGRLETIFRTNVQTAYSAGRYVQNNKPETKATHPFSRFSAVIDGRTSEICEELDGTVLPSDDAFWADHQPPLHFNCRSDVSAITAEDAQDYGIAEETPEVEPDEGFGTPAADLEPDLSSRPDELAVLFHYKTAGRE